jgi:dipeptidyl aminopeptidase/acylaminoacyl peptidase
MKPLLILHAHNDRSVAINDAMMMVDVPGKADAPRTFHRYPHKGHMGITDEMIQRAREFIEVQSL